MRALKSLCTKEKLILFVNIFFVLSIVLDLHVFYNSFSTFIRIVILSFLFLLIYILYSNKKERKYLLLYFFTLGIYIIFHLINCNQFNVSNIAQFSMTSELLYFIKMIMNVLIVYIIFKLNYKLKDFKKVLQLSTLVIAGSIVISNVFEIGYTSYDFSQLKYSIFDWFTGDYTFSQLSSKGFFHLTNQIAALLALYFSVLLIYLKEKVEWPTVLALVLGAVAMIMLGTRVSSYMPMILIVLSLIIYLLLLIVKREKLNTKFIICLIVIFGVSISIYQFSPIQIRNAYYKELFKNPSKPNKEDLSILATPVKDLSNKDFRKLLKLFNIDEDFYNDYYQLENDRTFYEYYIAIPSTKINDTRFLEKEVIKHITKLNENPKDKYMGIGYSRVINVFNIESDYTMQYYAIGIIGTILLLGVNIIILLWAYFKILFNLQRYFNYQNIMLLMSGTMFLATSYFSGNLLNSISCIIPISFIIGILLNELKNDNVKSHYESYLGLNTTTLTKDKIIKEIMSSKEQNIIFNINPLIVINNYKNVKNLSVINKNKYNIPDGNGIVLVSKIKSGNIHKSIPGIDLMRTICCEASKINSSIYLYGSNESSVIGTIDNLKKKYKNINIAGYSNGYIDEEVAIKQIKKAKPAILFVALGSPKQEDFIINYLNELKYIKIIMPVGGSFDVISGNIKRAPKLIIKLKLEWLYRMIKEPARFKQLGGIIKFLFLVLFSDICYNNKEEKNK